MKNEPTKKGKPKDLPVDEIPPWVFLKNNFIFKNIKLEFEHIFSTVFDTSSDLADVVLENLELSNQNFNAQKKRGVFR